MTPPTQLSDREKEVVKLLQEGKSNKLIASSLSISERTVEFHLKNIFNKYQVNSRVELILILGESTAAGKPGESTVADKEENPENRDRQNQWNLSTSLREAVSKIGKEFTMENVLNSNANNGSTPMTFFGSIRTCFVKYAEFNGRASRTEFWWFTLFILLVATALMYLSQTAGDVFLIATLLPFLAAGARRLHDVDRSGWWQLFMLAPIAGIVVVGFLWARPSTSPRPDKPTPA
jgi:DNA-binding CsgD family transcriptional regulator